METNIHIKITYKMVKRETPDILELTPEDYFDPLPSTENYQEDGIPKYNHTWEYLDNISPDELEWITEEISGTYEDRVIRTEFLENGYDNWMTHRRDKSGYEEIIHNTEILPNIGHTVRIDRNSEGVWKVNTNIVHYDSGTPNERWVSFLRK